MNAKKIIGAVLATVLGAALLTGCGAKAAGTSGTNTAASGWQKTITLSNGKTYPGETVTIICPYTAGGGTDYGIRLFAKYARQYTDAEIVVENIEGGDGLIGIAEGFKRGSDGSTLWHMDTGSQYVTTKRSVCPFYVLRDMLLVGQIAGDDRVWIARADEDRFGSGEELLAYSKAHPGELRCAVSGTGVISGLSTTYLSGLTGVELTVVGYDGTARAEAAFLAGEADIMSAGVSEVAPMLEIGQCKVLLSLTDERIYDDVPTVKELGYDAVSVSTDRGLAMHGETDPAIVQYWSDVMDLVCENHDFLAEAAEHSLVIQHRNASEFTEHFAQMYDVWYNLKAELGQ